MLEPWRLAVSQRGDAPVTSMVEQDQSAQIDFGLCRQKKTLDFQDHLLFPAHHKGQTAPCEK
jgi:hypothetical protein